MSSSAAAPITFIPPAPPPKKRRSPHHHPTTTSSSPSARTTTPPLPPPPSPSKRKKPHSPDPKPLPRLYASCSPPDLVALIADMLHELVQLNDKIPLSGAVLTRFHSRAPPTISIPDYLFRLAQHASLQPSILLSMVYYIDILSTHYPPFIISSLTVHRFLITAATVASKGLCDAFLTNSFYAKVGGVSLMELNMLELEFLVRVGWRIVPKPEVLEEYYRNLVKRLAGRFRIVEEKGEAGEVGEGKGKGKGKGKRKEVERGDGKTDDAQEPER